MIKDEIISSNINSSSTIASLSISSDQISFFSAELGLQVQNATKNIIHKFDKISIMEK